MLPRQGHPEPGPVSTAPAEPAGGEGRGAPASVAPRERPDRAKRFDWIGLRSRLALLAGLGVVAVGIGNYALLATLTREWLDRELEVRGRTLASAVAARIATASLARDPEGVQRELRYAAGEPDILGAAFHAADGTRIAESSRRPALWRALPWSAPPATADPVTVRALHVGTEHGIEVIVPFSADPAARPLPYGQVGPTGPGAPPASPGTVPAGWVRLLVSRERIDAAMRSTLRVGLAVVLASLLLVLVPIGLLMRRMLRPLREASVLAHEIAEGRLDRRLQARGNDELGTLARSMNRMAAGLVQARATAHAEASALRVAAEAVIAIAREARVTSDPRTVFDAVAVELRRVTGCAGVALVTVDPDASAPFVQQVDGAPVWKRVINSSPLGNDLRATLGDPGDRPARLVLGGRTDGMSRELARVGMLTALIVPLPLDDGPPSGLLMVAERPDAFPASEVNVVAGLASHLSSALRASLLRERLQRSVDDLEKTRAQLLHSERLRVAGEMASGIAHDFNNVLGAIQGRAQLLRRQMTAGALDEVQLTRSLEIIEQAARDGAETVRRLRQFGRPADSARLERVSIGLSLREAVEYTRTRWENEAQAAGRRIEVVQEIDPESWIEGRGTEVREVFTNLILNAIDALPDGGAIRVGCVSAGPLVRVWVEDDGIGMPAEVRVRIFDPFFSTKGERGTGLGLSVVFGIVQRHGGTLDVQSQPGEGTRFEMTFPRVAQAEGTPEIASLPQAPAAGLDVLIVDDEPAVRGLLSEILALLGHRVVERASAESALEFFEGRRFDLVLTDLGLPGMSGWDLARRLRAADPRVTIGFVTGWGEDVSQEKVEEAGGNGFIGKPFSIEDVESLTRMASQRSGEDRAAA